MELNERLKELRQEKKYSQAYVAEKLNISRQAISKWENGWSSPDIDNLILLSNLYGVQLEELTKFYSESTIDASVSQKNTEDTEHDANIPMLLISVIVSSIIPFVGCTYCIWILVKVWKKKLKIPRIVVVILMICFLINLNNSLIAINNLFFHMGKATLL